MAIQKPKNKKAPIDAVVSPLVLVDPGRKQLCIGTVFIVGAMGKDAIGITARHSIEYALRFEPAKRVNSAPGTPFQVATQKKEFSQVELRCAFDLGLPPMLGKAPADVVDFYDHPTSDIAYVHLRLAEGHRDVSRFENAIPMLSGSLELNETVRVIGFHQDCMTHEQRKVGGLPRLGSTDPAAFTLIRATLKNQAAEIVELMPDGYLDSKFPLFRVNCPFESGLSGGPVLVEREGRLIAAGMVCRDQQEVSDSSQSGRASGNAACAAVLSSSLDVPLRDVICEPTAGEEPKSLNHVRDLVEYGVLRMI